MPAFLVTLETQTGPQRQVWYAPFVGCSDQKPVEKIELPLVSSDHRWGIDEAIAFTTKGA